MTTPYIEEKVEEFRDQIKDVQKYPDDYNIFQLQRIVKAYKDTLTEVDRRAREEVEEKYKEIMTFDCMCDGTMLCAYHAERGYKVGWRGFADLTNLTPNQ